MKILFLALLLTLPVYAEDSTSSAPHQRPAEAERTQRQTRERLRLGKGASQSGHRGDKEGRKKISDEERDAMRAARQARREQRPGNTRHDDRKGQNLQPDATTDDKQP